MIPDHDTGNTLLDALTRAARGRGDAVLAHLPGGGTETYGGFFGGAARMGQALVAAGLSPGDRVAAQVPKSLAALQLYVGAVLAGGVFLPLNPAYTSAELDHFLTDAAPTVFVADPAREAEIAARTEATLLTLGADDGTGTLAEARDASAPLVPVPRGPDDLAAILYTSGTTGRPKGAMLSHANLASNSATLADLWRFTPEDVLIHALPIFHTHGLFVATNVTLMSGGGMVFLPGFDAEAILAAMPRATALMGVPTFYTRLLAQPDLAEAARGMRLFISGSAPLLAETHRQWEAATGHRILERYGMTETNMSTSNPYDGDRRAGTVGLPLPGVEMRLTNGKGTPVRDGESGVVEVRGPNVFRGYWNLPERTAEDLLPDGFFVTGDIGALDAAGYLQIIGRAKDLVICGGFNVYPKEVEALIDPLPGVTESAVIGVPHPDLGEAVVAVVAVTGPDATTPEAILGAIAPDLARFKQPRHIALVDALPRNTMGKVQKAALRETYAALFT